MSDLRIDISGLGLLALTALLLLAFAAVIAMPFNISGIVQSFGVSNAAAGLVASVEMASVALGSLVFAQLAPRLNPRQVYVTALGLIIAMNLATVFAPSVGALYLTRALAGVGAGAVVATVMSVASRSSRPESTFGVINSCVGVMGMILSLVLPQALKLHLLLADFLSLSPADGLYLVYFVASLLALAFIRLAPVPPPVVTSTHSDHTPIPSLPIYGWLALLGLGVVFFGHALLAVFIVEVGLGVALTPEVIGIVFLLGSGFGVVAPLVSGYLGMRFSALVPVACILVAVGCFALLLAHATTPWQFFLAGPFYAMMPIALMPFVLGALARIDPTGRLAGAHPAFVMLGSAAAPLTGGAIRDLSGHFIGNGWAVVACVLVGAALLAKAVSASDRMRVSTGAARPGHAPAAVAGTPR